MKTCRIACAWMLLAASAAASAQDAAPAKPPGSAVGEILARHDRAALDELAAHIAANPDAPDRDQAHLAAFEIAIKNDWYDRARPLAAAYLEKTPQGAVRPMALIVTTMAEAQAGRLAAALDAYRSLLSGLDAGGQAEFAVEFADSLAAEASARGDYDAARRVHTLLRDALPDLPDVADRAAQELERYALVGRPASLDGLRSLDGTPLDTAALRGKWVLLDFWATWCSPCQANLPLIRKARDDFHARGFEVVSVSLDDDARTVADYVKSQSVPWPQLHAPTCGKDLVAAFAVGTIPQAVLLAPDGTIHRLDVRPRDLDALLHQKLGQTAQAPSATR
jgi:thiol-disulfide isomerase/thioredoxin